MPKRKQTSAASIPSPELSEREKVFAATGNPALATDEFKLGDHTFKVMNLRYKDYLSFLFYLEPLLKGVGNAVAKSKGVNLPDGLIVEPQSFSGGKLLEFCSDALPEMVRLMCIQTDSTVTADQVMDWGADPFVLAAIVVKQIVRNNIVGSFASFFAQTLPLMTSLGVVKTKPTESKIEAVPISS